MLSPVNDPNKLKTLTFFSDLAGRLEKLSQEPEQNPSIVLGAIKGAAGAAFGGLKGVVDTLNTTADGQTPLQNIVDGGKIKKVKDALTTLPIALNLPPADPNIGIFEGFVGAISGLPPITDPKTLDYLEKIVNELESSFQSLETVEELKNEIMYMIAPVLGQKFLANYIPPALSSVISGLMSHGGQLALTGAAKALLWTLSGRLLPYLRGLIGKKLGLTPQEAEKISTDSYASLLQSTVGLFLAPLKKKIADDRALIAGNLSWEQIDKKINSLRASIATSTKEIEEQIRKIESQQAPGDTTATTDKILEMAKQAKELEELVRLRAEPERVKLETTKKDLETLLAHVREVMKNPGVDPKTSFLNLIRDIEEKFPEVSGAPTSPLYVIINDLKAKVSNLPTVPPPLPENEFLDRITKMLARHEKPSKAELDQLIKDIENKFPRELELNAPMYRIIDNVETAPKSEIPATPAPKEEGWWGGAWNWAVGLVVGVSPSSSNPLNQLKDFFAAEVAKKQQGWLSWIGGGVVGAPGAIAGWLKSNPVNAPLDKLEKFFLAAIVENQKVIELNATVKVKASTIVEKTGIVVELESKKQEKIIFTELKKNYNAQLEILKGLGENITDLKDGIDRYQNGYFKFFHKFFGTERYKVHNVLEAHQELEELSKAKPTGNVNTEAQRILEAQEKFGEALGKLDKTHQLPIAKTGHIKAALKAHEKLEEFRPKKPAVEPPSSPEPAVVTVAEVPLTAPKQEATPEVVAKPTVL